MRTARLILCTLLSLASCGVWAQLNLVAWYRLGEADPGATPGGPGANPTIDSAGAFDLASVGAPTYSVTPSPPSALSMAFAGADGYRNGAPVSLATDNFGLEAWVFSTSTAGNAVIAYNGNTGSSGWGIFRAGANYHYLFGGVVVGGGTPVLLNRWTHLAVVRDAGVTTFYVNGRPNNVSGNAPNAPAGAFGIGINPLLNQEFHVGDVDEVRAFTFAPGTFSPALLLAAAPPRVPTMSEYALLLLVLMLAGVAYPGLRRR